MEPRVRKRFYGIRAGDHSYTQFNPGDVCPPELVELATEQDALEPADAPADESEEQAAPRKPKSKTL